VSKKLVVSDGTRERELQLVGTVVVGRDPLCDITYDDALLSRRHAEFVAAGDQVTVRDLGSRNGVFVNGAKVAERSLRSGDVIQIGPVRARFVADAAPLGTAPEKVDAGYTAVIQHAAAAALPTPASLPLADDDGDRTRMIPAPRSLQTQDSAVGVAPPPPLYGDDDEKTQFIQSSPVATPIVQPQAPPEPALRSVPAPPSVPRPDFTAEPFAEPTMVVRRSAESRAPAPPPAVPPAPDSLTAFVFVRVLALAAVVLFAAAIPLVVWRRGVLSGVDPAGGSAPIVWLALPVAVAVAAAYYVSALINRRFVHALADVERGRGGH